MDVVNCRRFLAIIFLAAVNVSCIKAMSLSEIEQDPKYRLSFYSNLPLPQDAGAEEIAERLSKIRSAGYGCPKNDEYKDKVKKGIDPLQRRFNEAYGRLSLWGKTWFHRRRIVGGTLALTGITAVAVAHKKGYDRAVWNRLPEPVQNALERAAKNVCRFVVRGGQRLFNKAANVGEQVSKALEEQE